MNDLDAIEVARCLSVQLTAFLAKSEVSAVKLDRSEAAIILGLLNGLVEVLEAERCSEAAARTIAA